MATVVLGVTGSIAAYKACELTRLMIRDGLEVAVVMTKSATEFVTPLTFRTLSKQPVEIDMFELSGAWMPGHISLADRADLFVVAPCTANVLAKIANGIADDLLTSTALATRAPILLAPAMNSGMWENPATRANAATVTARGIRLINGEVGELACGTTGNGRMAEPSAIFAVIKEMLHG